MLLGSRYRTYSSILLNRSKSSGDISTPEFSLFFYIIISRQKLKGIIKQDFLKNVGLSSLVFFLIIYIYVIHNAGD